MSSLNIGLWLLAIGYSLLLFVWILGVEPYVRRRTRKSTFFLLPWAPWKDYLDGRRLVHRYPKTPWFFHLFLILSIFEILGILVWIALMIAR